MTIAWSMASAACLTLGAVYLLVWILGTARNAYLPFAMMAFGCAANAIFELLLMKTGSVETYQVLLRWEVFSVGILIISLVWAVRVHLGTGRIWLAWIICALWAVVLMLNFLSENNGVFKEVSALHQISTIGGETFTVAEGIRNPWTILADLASLLIVFYVVDASLALWRRGNRRRALLVGGSIIFFILVGGIQAPLVDLGILKLPYMISFAFLAIVLSMGFEMGLEVVRAGQLSEVVRFNEQRWRILLENIDLVVVGLDLDGCINYANPFFTRLIGDGDAELVGRPLVNFIVEREQAHFLERLAIGITSGPRPHSLWSIRCSNGEERRISWSSVRLTDDQQAPLGLLSIGADITDRLKAQEALQQALREVEHTTRTNLAGELASALAHELNQPLAAILSNAQAGQRFMKGGAPDLKELQAILDDIVRDDKRAGDVIHRLRGILRRGPVVRETCNFNEIIKEVLQFLHSEIVSCNAEVTTDLEEELPSLDLGRVEMQQVMINLIMNALQAMAKTPESQRIVRIQSRRLDRSIQIAVQDRGHGIPQERLEKIFEPFVTSKSTGLGMGLAICQRLVEAHGGWMQARNNPDGGAEFFFTLPVSVGKKESKDD